MQQVGVDGERRLALLVLGDRDLVLFCKGEQFRAALERPVAPRCDDLDVGVEGIGGEFETDLVVALAGRTMGDRIRARLAGDIDQML